MRIKNFIKRAACLFTAAVLLVLNLPVGASAAGGADTVYEYYGRAALEDLPNSEALLYAYDAIYEGVGECKNEIRISDGTNKISVEEIRMVADVYRRDHTEQFWVANNGNISYTTEDDAISYVPTYFMTGEELADAKLKFAEKTDEILSHITQGMSDFEKELAIHDILAERVAYIDSENAHNAYGAIVEGKAVCEGYAEALQYLLMMCNIQSFIIVGSSVNPATNQPEGHAWNAVKIDGKFYHVDLTWNDQASYLYHAYFNITDTEIERDHTITETEYDLPVCNSTEENYFVKNGGSAAVYTVETIGARLKYAGLETSVYISSGTAADFIDWCQNNIRDIAEAAGVSGSFSHSYSSLGREVVIAIDTCLHTNLTPVGAKSAECESAGNIAYFVCECGKYFKDKDASKPTNPTEVKLFELGHSPKTQYSNDGESHWFECNRCDKKLQLSAHVYDSACDGECNVCAYTRSVTHDYSSSWESDKDAHWRECSCSAKTDVTEHADSDGNAVCDVCAYELKKPGGNSLFGFFGGINIKLIGIGAAAVFALIIVIAIAVNLKRR